jgi:arginine:ornithine antiporter/lysine permease
MMVVGSMVGAGIFSLPRAFGNATGPFGAIIAWIIAAGGMYTLARVFQALAERKPDLDAGVYAYAKAGFGVVPPELQLSCSGFQFAHGEVPKCR